MSAIENDLTRQLTNYVTNIPRGGLPILRIAAKSTFIIMGMIMSKIRTAIGKLIWLLLPNSICETQMGIRPDYTAFLI